MYIHSIFYDILLTLALCQDGDVRLVGGQLAYEGRVEVCFSQRWGTVADDGWPTGFAQVVCRQLGYDTQGIIITLLLFLILIIIIIISIISHHSLCVLFCLWFIIVIIVKGNIL